MQIIKRPHLNVAQAIQYRAMTLNRGTIAINVNASKNARDVWKNKGIIP